MEGRLFMLVAASMAFATPAMSSTSSVPLNITGAGCGATKVCVAYPAGCDPVVNQTTCLFASVTAYQPVSGNFPMSFELTGQSSGYIAVGLNASQPSATTYMCGQNSSGNGTTFFYTAQTDANGVLNLTNTTATNYTSWVNSSLIQCTFSTFFSTTNVTILLGYGTFNSITNQLGIFNVSIKSSPVTLNLTTMPTAATTATAATTPTTPTPPKATVAPGASCALQPYALLVLLSVLTLSILQEA